MNRMFKRSGGDGAFLCAACVPAEDRLTVAELDPKLFPGTYGNLRCSVCGTGPWDAEDGSGAGARGARGDVLDDPA